MSGCQYLGPEYDPMKHRGPAPFCGAQTVEGKSYCHEHYWVIYQRGSAVAGKKKEKQIDAELIELKRQQEIDEMEAYE